MSNSRDINYGIRPAKGVERKMLLELASRLSGLFPVSNYQYVGYGAAYFCDFSLFHKALNICDMISIEHDAANIARYEYNLPYNCVKILPGKASDILPGLPWESPAIVWMDEICEPSVDLFETVRSVVRQLKPGSLIVVTFRELRLAPDSLRIEAMKKLFGRYFTDTDKSAVEGPKLREAVSKVFRTAIAERLSQSNSGLASNEHRDFIPLLNLSYADGARMTTLGGLIVNQSQIALCKKLELDKLAFVVNSASPDRTYEISVPNLTLKEVRALSEAMPISADYSTLGKMLSLPQSDIEAFGKIYRYYLNMGEIISA